MKAILQKLILIAAVFAVSTAAAQSTKSVQKAVIQTKISCDHCKHCGTCTGLLERTLLKSQGVQMITLDEKAMTITVIYNSKKTTLERIRAAISMLGYDADDIKADLDAYKKLDPCCKIQSR